MGNMNKTKYPFWGLIIGIIVYLLWFVILGFSLVKGHEFSFPQAVVFIMILTFLNTGLFIQSHDCMHETFCENHKKINNFFGRLFVLSYAMFDYAFLKTEHMKHHQAPGQVDHDPDFHRGRKTFFSWYFSFMSHYINVIQLIKMSLVFWGLWFIFPLSSVLSFWAMPALLSTLQLFYFGTYLPHREGVDLHTIHRARTIKRSYVMSFITCYHFGIHLEHHLYPHVPWWKLPSVRI